jgi:hypothetical protein
MTKEFLPTYLCIKQHSITGLLYFCKTTKSYKKMLKYVGSGKPYWNNHLKIHGKEFVETIWYCLFYDKESIKEFALMCSEQWNVMHGLNEDGKKIWANLKPENGLEGGSGPHSEATKSLQKKANLGVKKTEKAKQNMRTPKGPMKEEFKALRSKSGKGKQQLTKWITDGTKNKKIRPVDLIPEGWREGRIQKKAIPRGTDIKVSCPHCSKLVGNRSKNRYHFDNCKLAPKPIIREKVCCPHCGTEGTGNAMYQWHFNNCRSK